MVFRGIRKLLFVKIKKNSTHTTAISILVHTKGNASREIILPNMAVNPHINTIKCSCK